MVHAARRVTSSDGDGNTPARMAAFEGFTELARYLDDEAVRRGADGVAGGGEAGEEAVRRGGDSMVEGGASSAGSPSTPAQQSPSATNPPLTPPVVDAPKPSIFIHDAMAFIETATCQTTGG